MDAAADVVAIPAVDVSQDQSVLFYYRLCFSDLELNQVLCLIS